MPLNRRKFIKQSAATGAGAAFTGAAAAPAARAAQPRTPVRRPGDHQAAEG